MACSGTVLAPTVVLTAAHCVVDEQTRTIRSRATIVVTAGSLDRASGAGVEVGAARIAVHPDYDPGAIRSDAAVIRLATPLTVAPVTLAAVGDARPRGARHERDLRRLGTTSGGSTQASDRC